MEKERMPDMIYRYRHESVFAFNYRRMNEYLDMWTNEITPMSFTKTVLQLMALALILGYWFG